MRCGVEIEFDKFPTGMALQRAFIFKLYFHFRFLILCRPHFSEIPFSNSICTLHEVLSQSFWAWGIVGFRVEEAVTDLNPQSSQPRETSPSAAPRTGLESLPSYGSSYPTAGSMPIRQCAINVGTLCAIRPKQRAARPRYQRPCRGRPTHPSP